MSRFAALLARYCPDGVRTFAIADFTMESTTRNRGQRVVEVRSVTNDRGLARTSEVFENTRTSADTSNYKIVEPGMFVYNPSRVNVGSIAWLDESAPVIVSPMYVVFSLDTSRVLAEYLMLYLGSRTGKNRIESKTEVGARFRLTYASLSRIRVPLPPLPIQRAIVQMLGHFTDLELELKAELDARRRQYDYYSSRLLAADADVPRVRFGDVATIVRGASPRPIQHFITDEPDGVPWIKIGDVPAEGKYITCTSQRVTLAGAAKSRRVSPGDFVLSNSMSFGRPYISKIEGYIHDGWLAVSAFEKSFLPDYLYYLLRSAPIQDEFRRRAGSGTVQNLNAEIVRSVEVPLPPRDVQARVVELLDRFDSFSNDSSVGLPAELNARRKQREYYRDSLLSFKEITA